MMDKPHHRAANEVENEKIRSWFNGNRALILAAERLGDPEIEIDLLLRGAEGDLVDVDRDARVVA